MVRTIASSAVSPACVSRMILGLGFRHAVQRLAWATSSTVHSGRLEHSPPVCAERTSCPRPPAGRRSRIACIRTPAIIIAQNSGTDPPVRDEEQVLNLGLATKVATTRSPRPSAADQRSSPARHAIQPLQTSARPAPRTRTDPLPHHSSNAMTTSRIAKAISGRGPAPPAVGLPAIIAEAGVNHEGSSTSARRLVDEAAEGAPTRSSFNLHPHNPVAVADSPAYWDFERADHAQTGALFSECGSFWRGRFFASDHSLQRTVGIRRHVDPVRRGSAASLQQPRRGTRPSPRRTSTKPPRSSGQVAGYPSPIVLLDPGVNDRVRGGRCPGPVRRRTICWVGCVFNS